MNEASRLGISTYPWGIEDGAGRKHMLAGDLIAGALKRLGSSFTFDSASVPLTLVEFDEGGTDPGNIVEFLTFELPFDVEPTTGLIFPPEVDGD